MKKVYHFFMNPFLPKGKRNYKRMMSLAYDHFSALFASKEDAVINNLYLRTEPVLQKFEEHITLHISSENCSIAGVFNFINYHKEIPKRLRNWERKILNIISEDSPVYIELFPKGKRAVYKCSHILTVSQMHSLEISLGEYPELQAIYLEVKDFNQQLYEAFENKGLTSSANDKTSTELKEAYTELGIMLYRNLLALTEYYAPDTHRVEHFFKLYLLRQHKVIK